MNTTGLNALRAGCSGLQTSVIKLVSKEHPYYLDDFLTTLVGCWYNYVLTASIVQRQNPIRLCQENWLTAVVCAVHAIRAGVCFTPGAVPTALPLVVCLQVAVRRTMAAGKGSGVQHLRNFTAEGKPVADPEDDKLWLSMESKHTLLEFDFARTWQQVRLRDGGFVSWVPLSPSCGHPESVPKL